MTRRIAGRGVLTLLATTVMRLRLFRVRDGVTERPKKIYERSRFHRLCHDQRSRNRQRKDQCTQWLSHNDTSLLEIPAYLVNISISAMQIAIPATVANAAMVEILDSRESPC